MKRSEVCGSCEGTRVGLYPPVEPPRGAGCLRPLLRSLSRSRSQLEWTATILRAALAAACPSRGGTFSRLTRHTTDTRHSLTTGTATPHAHGVPHTSTDTVIHFTALNRHVPPHARQHSVSFHRGVQHVLLRVSLRTDWGGERRATSTVEGYGGRRTTGEDLDRAVASRAASPAGRALPLAAARRLLATICWRLSAAQGRVGPRGSGRGRAGRGPRGGRGGRRRHAAIEPGPHTQGDGTRRDGGQAGRAGGLLLARWATLSVPGPC